MKYILNGEFLNGAFKHEGISYPANWTVLSLPAERAALGIVDVPPPSLPPDYDADVYELVEDASKPPYRHYRRRDDSEIEAIRQARGHCAMSSLDFLRLFEPERRAIKQAAMQNVDIGIWYDDTVAAQFVTYSDPRVEQGLAALVDAGLLLAERKAEIVARMQER